MVVLIGMKSGSLWSEEAVQIYDFIGRAILGDDKVKGVAIGRMA